MTTAEEDNKYQPFKGLHGEKVGAGFLAREQAARSQQEKREIEFKIVRNDGQRESLKHLLDVKNIFARLLPKMPKEYVVRLVFDRNHESIIILQNGTKLIGGTCFRVFKEEKFAEIAFLAINSTEQVQGFGTRLMNKLKEEMQRRGVEYLITYADNLAIGYFRKQGFTKEPRMAQERWKGYIKDYEGGTKMECEINSRIDYSRVSDIIRAQQQLVYQKVKELCINHVTFDGKELEKRAQPYIHINRETGEQEHFRINPMDIPGVKQGGWTWADHEELVKTKEVSFILECQNIVEMMRKQHSSWPFREPVPIEDVPDYLNTVKEPIDLQTIEKKVTMNLYGDYESFCDDVLKIFRNCRLYNQPETPYVKCANELEAYIKPYLESLKEGKLDLSAEARKMTNSKLAKKKIIQKVKKSHE